MVMSKSMSVTFSDGTSHTFDEVPDDVTQEQVNAKAKEQFPDREIMDTSEGAHPDAPALPTPEQKAKEEPSVATQAMGIASVPIGLAAAHPGTTAAIGAGGAALYKANKIADTFMEGAKANKALAEARMASEQGIAQRAASKAEQAAAKMGGARAPMPGPAAPAVPQAMPQTAPTAAPAPAATMAPKPPPVGGVPGQEGANFIDSIAQKYTQIAGRFAPTLQGIAESPLGRVVGGAARIAGSTPVLGAQLMTHSAGLNTDEDRLLAEKHRLEAQMLMNKHAAEWNKYKNAATAQQ